MTMTTDAMLDTSRILKLAAEIRRVDGGHKCGAAELAERLMPFIDAHIAEECAKVVDALENDPEFVPRWCDDSHGQAYVEGWNDCRAAYLSTHPATGEKDGEREGVV